MLLEVIAVKSSDLIGAFFFFYVGD